MQACTEVRNRFEVSEQVPVERVGDLHKVTINFDTEKKEAALLIDGTQKKVLNLSAAIPFGISYLHMQTLADTRDYEGSYVRFIDFKAD